MGSKTPPIPSKALNFEKKIGARSPKNPIHPATYPERNT
jgi:hypothetical protein